MQNRKKLYLPEGSKICSHHQQLRCVPAVNSISIIMTSIVKSFLLSFYIPTFIISNIISMFNIMLIYITVRYKYNIYAFL